MCNFTEIEGSYVEKMCFVFELHRRNTFCERIEMFVKKAAFENKTRAISLASGIDSNKKVMKAARD